MILVNLGKKHALNFFLEKACLLESLNITKQCSCLSRSVFFLLLFLLLHYFLTHFTPTKKKYFFINLLKKKKMQTDFRIGALVTIYIYCVPVN